MCIIGLTFILAWVPHLDSGDKNAANLFSTYQGISAVGNAVALMSFSILASAMGFRYLTNEYCGGNAVLLFSYPMNRKSVVWAKVAVILLFISVAIFLTQFFGFLIFTGTDSVLGMVNCHSIARRYSAHHQPVSQSKLHGNIIAKGKL